MAGLYVQRKRKFKLTTDCKHRYPIADNLLNREFTTTRPNSAWVSDITYVKTGQGWLYLTVILDLFSRKVVGWSLAKGLSTRATVLKAWRMAVKNRKITKPLIFHSDRGLQYAATIFKNVLKANPLVNQSMSRKANCWDNAVAESFFKSLKYECVYSHNFKTRQDAELTIFQYIECWYNRHRLHSTLNYLTPTKFETQFYNKKKIA
ncbi:UNVERIFIED_CONTAM: hypothetical protein GTU68_050054 [Idotea baltica]|nr:hypothetical protein [Idotea baltica]